MKLWQKLWLLFTVIWVVVAMLNVVSILAFGDEVPADRALWPIVFALVVPGAAYLVGWAWDKWRNSG